MNLTLTKGVSETRSHQRLNVLFVNMDRFPVLQGGMAPEHGDTCDPLEAIR